MISSSDLLSDLSPPQREAVTHKDGPLLIIAGAGSGKTRVVTRRIAYLIHQGVNPYSILALTFTNKAAGEMKERVFKFFPNTDLWISTFHSTAVRILRREITPLGYNNNFTIYDEADSAAAIKEALKRLNLDPAMWRVPMLRHYISRAKNALLGPDDIHRMCSTVAEGRIIARVYAMYAQILKENNALDFDDLLIKLLELFNLRPDICQRYQEKFRYILIDEYQDTNRCQYLLAKILAERHRNICATGDPDQSIYTWRGADIQNILDFEKDYPDAKVVKLEQNYRSTKRILYVASELIKHNHRRKEKTLWTDAPAGEKICLIECEDETDEAEAVAERIAELRRKGWKPSDFAVFYRINAQSRNFESALRNHSLPYVIVGGVEFFQRREVKDVLAYLRLLLNPSDTVSFTRIANIPPRGIGEATVSALKNWAQEQGLPIFAAIQRCEEIRTLSPKALAGLKELRHIYQRLAELPPYPVAPIVKAVIKTAKFEDYLRQEGLQGEERIENIAELVNDAAQYDEREPDGSLAGYLEQVTLIADVDKWNHKANAVTLMTLHSAKGLEFPVVFITGLEAGLLPHARATEEDRDEEEERRLCYVGITRAKQLLFLTFARTRTRFGLRIPSLPSPFLAELPQDALRHVRYGLAVSDDSFASSTTAYWSELEEDDDAIMPGDTVEHPTYGIGHVISLSGWGKERRARVKFRGIGEKTLVLTYAKLRKLV